MFTQLPQNANRPIGGLTESIMYPRVESSARVKPEGHEKLAGFHEALKNTSDIMARYQKIGSIPEQTLDLGFYHLLGTQHGE